MKVLITGGAGFIGSYTTDLLLEKGYEVRIIDSLEPPVHRQKTKPKYIPADAEFILGDVRNRNNMEKALKGVDAVFHLAAYQGYLTDFSTFAHINDYGTALIYEIIVAQHLPIQKVVLASSQAVYGEGKYRCTTHGIQYPSPRPLEQLKNGDWDIRCPFCQKVMKSLPTDETKVNPHNQYAVSKYSQELYALTLGRRFAIPTVALRYSIAQGPRQSFSNAYSGVLRIFTTKLLNNLSPVVYEDGKQLRDYVPVWDVAEANLLVLESEAANFEAYNVGGGKAISVLEFARLLLSIISKDVGLQCSGEFRFGDARHIVSDIAKLKSLGWQPKVSAEKTVKEYIRWIEQEAGVSDYYAEAEKVMRQQGVLQIVR